MLHLTKIAFGCTALSDLSDWIEREAAEGEVFITTRYRPKREAELAGGSLFWILKHQIVARQRILGFVEPEEGSGRWRIRLEARLIAIHPRPRRAHQGWRYLPEADAPADLAAGEAAGASIPPAMAAELAALGLI